MIGQAFLVSLLLSICFVSASPTFLETSECPECRWSLEELVKNNGYIMETHKTIAADGFVLKLHRIAPNPGHSPLNIDKPGHSRSPVVLMHGLMDSSACWLLNLPQQSLAYILADEGYDVWMPNSRGNCFSPPALSHHPESWKFSFDEMAEYDVPAFVSYIKQKTQKERISWVGHSQGSTQLFAQLATHASFSQHLNIFIALAPAIYESHSTSFLLQFLSRARIDSVIDSFGSWSSFMGHSPLYYELASLACVKPQITADLCELALFQLVGREQDVSQKLNQTRLPLYANHEPAGTSAHNIAHWMQMIRSGKFRKFDFGYWGNLLNYGQWHPPAYDIGAIDPQLPIAIFSGSDDALADSNDISMLLRTLPKVHYQKCLQGYDHLDYIWSLDAHQFVYQDVLRLLELANNNKHITRLSYAKRTAIQ